MSNKDFNDIHLKHFESKLLSARLVLKHLFSFVSPKSIIDVGCGHGAWIKAAEELGVSDVLGLEGSWIDKNLIQIPDDKIKTVDFNTDFNLERKFELVVSLEVAEHLEKDRAESFVKNLTSLGDIVLFSAAIPFQGGNGHINEQFQHYWAEMFIKNGMIPVDIIRPFIWWNDDVTWWFRQNTILYVKLEKLKDYPNLGQYAVKDNIEQLSTVHPELYMQWIQRFADAAGQIKKLN